MSSIRIPTSFNIELEFVTPEFHKRLFAWLVDLAVQIAYIILIGQILSGFHGSGTGDDTSNDYNQSYLAYILYAPLLLYHLVCEIMMNGQSPGKKLFAIRVISESGGRPSFSQFLMRWLLRLVDFSFTVGFCAFISSLVTKKNQRLGDLAAGTIVIQEKRIANLSDTVFLEVEDNYTPRYPAVISRLSDRDMNAIKNIIDTTIKTHNYDLAHRTADRIRTMAGITEYQDSLEFLETVLKDYNYLANQE